MNFGGIFFARIVLLNREMMQWEKKNGKCSHTSVPPHDLPVLDPKFTFNLTKKMKQVYNKGNGTEGGE